MAVVRLHLLFLITLGFLLGNSISYAQELPIVNQTVTTWVTPIQYTVATIAYDDVKDTHKKELSTVVLPYAYRYIQLRHTMLTTVSVSYTHLTLPTKA